MRERTFFEADDGTLFRTADQCQLYDTVRSEEKRKRALEKTEQRVKALQCKIDTLKGRSWSPGSNHWAGRFEYTRGIDRNSEQGIKEKCDIEATWTSVQLFAEQWGFTACAPENASFNQIHQHLSDKLASLRGVYFVYRYAEKRLSEFKTELKQRRGDTGILVMVGFYSMYTAAAKTLMGDRRRELDDARKKLRIEKKKLARLVAADPGWIKADGAVTVAER